ncbi:Abscission/NoCut checkpoint regulator [Podospora australis]|uniref:Abscission/NoCut checkpoint regulator n=1 Tax=Podospora australis TaxID=1536484 RepID=A0AAN7ANN1_9PEZI|nr:Abscission/NoCut checkpoint regulator [Podospora australis]
MAAPRRPNDQSLLDRLNALKPTSVTLDSSTNTAAATVSVGGQTGDDQPLSREDALTERLRSLRNASSSAVSPQPQGNVAPNPKEKVGKDDQALSPSSSASSNTPKAPVKGITTTAMEQPKSPYAFEEGADVDYDDQAVDDYLAALGEEDISAYTAADHEEDDKVTDKKVADLLEKLQKAIPPGEDTDPEAEDDDDSDGEYMTRASKKILDQARDEISLLSPTETVGGEENGDNQRKSPPDNASNPTDQKSNDNNNNPLSLPTVPTALVDPVDEDQDFETDISARLAGLRGIGPVDSFGLPAAPTFRPEDRTGTTGLLKTKYTDDDQENWCTVCLEDATIRCVGCDNDAYCGRCWREMHVGPRAGYDERGHQWVKFSPSRGGEGRFSPPPY